MKMSSAEEKLLQKSCQMSDIHAQETVEGSAIEAVKIDAEVVAVVVFAVVAAAAVCLYHDP